MKHLGNLLLGVWLVLQGLKAVLGLHFQYDHMILGVLAITAGVFVTMRG
jgi:hypothetical protein